MKIIKQGAEAKLYLEGNKLIKERIKKNYRIKEIDIEKRKYPTRKEARLLEKASSLINVPKVYQVDDEKMTVVMEYINGATIKDLVPKLDLKDLKKIFIRIGEQVAKLHENNIIHNDLTTSNMIFKDNKVYFIDFGLGFISSKIEDKAVDLHLFKQVLESKHYKQAKKAFDYFLQSYKLNKEYKEVLTRLEKVEKRGRYKT